MKTLLTVTAIFEGVTGLLLLLAPAFVISVLLGSSLEGPTGILIGRLAGIAFISITIACWVDRNEKYHAGGIIKSLMFFNIATAALLVYAGVSGFSGVAIGPVSLAHAGMAAWCVRLLKKK